MTNLQNETNMVSLVNNFIGILEIDTQRRILQKGHDSWVVSHEFGGLSQTEKLNDVFTHRVQLEFLDAVERIQKNTAAIEGGNGQNVPST